MSLRTARSRRGLAVSVVSEEDLDGEPDGGGDSSVTVEGELDGEGEGKASKSGSESCEDKNDMLDINEVGDSGRRGGGER
jgi:hypothetical protein